MSNVLCACLFYSSFSLAFFKCHFCCPNVPFLPEHKFCQKTHVPLQEVAQGFFFLDVCVSSIWCGGVGSSAVPCWCVAACVFCGGPSDLSQSLQHSPAKSNMCRERCSLPSAVTPAVILRNRHSVYVIRCRKTGDDELKVTQTLHTDMHAKRMRLQ